MAKVDTLSNATKVREELELSFSGPASSNQLVGIKRSTTYKDVLQAPSINDLKKALVQKYGAPSFQREFHGMYQLSWTFSNGTQRNCRPEGECSTPGTSYSAPHLVQYMNDTNPVDLGIQITVQSSAFDGSKVASILIYLGSTTKKKLTAKADMDSLTVAGTNAWSEASQKVSAPKL